jgi:hypothetical protein
MSERNRLDPARRTGLNLGKALEDMRELEKDKEDLRQQGLTEVEIEGFVEMFIDGYITIEVDNYEN